MDGKALDGIFNGQNGFVKLLKCRISIFYN